MESVYAGNKAVLVSQYGLFSGSVFCLSSFPQPVYTVFKGKSVNMMAIYNASKVNDRFRSLIQKGKLTDWYQIDLDISVKLSSRLLLIYCQT